MICVLDESGYCARHKRKHIGRELQLALLDTEEGEKYRQYWERKDEPSFVKKVVSFTKAVAKHVATGMKNVSDEEYARRLAICDTCQACDKTIEQWQCRECGCYLREGDVRPGKARWADQKCPLKKWGEVEIKKGGCGCNAPS